mmetsp:Transcript_19241/g.41608  ORF Transcript_19241/g.41608 Transcript_19241/m.41608 type:complete len:270 (+) Transcript_19241:70-879(+)
MLAAPLSARRDLPSRESYSSSFISSASFIGCSLCSVGVLPPKVFALGPGRNAGPLTAPLDVVLEKGVTDFGDSSLILGMVAGPLATVLGIAFVVGEDLLKLERNGGLLATTLAVCLVVDVRSSGIGDLFKPERKGALSAVTLPDLKITGPFSNPFLVPTADFPPFKPGLKAESMVPAIGGEPPSFAFMKPMPNAAPPTEDSFVVLGDLLSGDTKAAPLRTLPPFGCIPPSTLVLMDCLSSKAARTARLSTTNLFCCATQASDSFESFAA